MIRYLIDTNILAELRKSDRCNPSVTRWRQLELIPYQGAVSVITLGEIRKEIELLRVRDKISASRLERWLQRLYRNYGDRILSITSEIAEEWGRLNAQRPLPAADSLLGATANVHGLVLATRNTKDLLDTGIRLVNPFAFECK